ncbi:NAD(P)H-dependent oxidoreductase subunit E [Fusibacter sp. 3D3]|uniref:NADH-quinone oxidoreductase subunit NuoE family protein n=1 Tax=Fusibacter sp. 3D3 TaxID=1048380 RepID=UPI0008533C9E|nr:NAD(P)H-dependent oxidoreductase subunit E [Fusibacter sp. 3D3]GAU78136.1 NAD-reducing hydrogenase subunit HoxE [Fusibacter sp. 3D3]
MADVFSLDNAKEKLEALDAFVDAQASKEDALIAVLHKAQDLFGYLPSELQLYVARKLKIPASKVYGVVSFYSYFTQEKRGEFTVSICMGTACFVKGIDKVVDEFTKQLGVKFGETTPDGLFTMNDVRCIGACGLAPVVMVNDKVFGHVKASDVAGIIETYKNSERSE